MQHQTQLLELNEKELSTTNGGSFLGTLLRKTLWGAIVYEVASNWGSIKEGIQDGWNNNYGCDTCGN